MDKYNYKLKIFIILCLFSFLIIIINNSFSNFKIGSFISRYIQYNIRYHKLGQAILNPNGTLMYFHLPKLDDYKIENDYYELKTITNSKYCSKKGSILTLNKFVAGFNCNCKLNYYGNDCSMPDIVFNLIKENNEIIVKKLTKPRRILLSLIWLSFGHNEEEIKSNLDKFYYHLDNLSTIVDLFVIHEISISQYNNNTLKYLLEFGAFNKLKPITIVKVLKVNPKNLEQYESLEHIEYKLMKNSWKIFFEQVTEYRSDDLIIFMSFNQLPKDDLMVFFKHNTGIRDVIQLNPILKFKFNNGSLIKQYNQINNEKLKFGIANSILSFQYISLLCQFSFEQFSSNNCLFNKELTRHFQKFFWSIIHLPLGNDKNQATNVIF